MRKMKRQEIDKQSFVAIAATLWVCCALVVGGILFALFGWQVGAVGIVVSTLLVLVGSIRLMREGYEGGVQ